MSETKPQPRLTFWGPREEPVPQGTGEAARRAAEKIAKREAEAKEHAEAAETFQKAEAAASKPAKSK